MSAPPPPGTDGFMLPPPGLPPPGLPPVPPPPGIPPQQWHMAQQQHQMEMGAAHLAHQQVIQIQNRSQSQIHIIYLMFDTDIV